MASSSITWEGVAIAFQILLVILFNVRLWTNFEEIAIKSTKAVAVESSTTKRTLHKVPSIREMNLKTIVHILILFVQCAGFFSFWTTWIIINIIARVLVDSEKSLATSPYMEILFEMIPYLIILQSVDLFYAGKRNFGIIWKAPILKEKKKKSIWALALCEIVIPITGVIVYWSSDLSVVMYFLRLLQPCLYALSVYMLRQFFKNGNHPGTDEKIPRYHVANGYFQQLIACFSIIVTCSIIYCHFHLEYDYVFRSYLIQLDVLISCLLLSFNILHLWTYPRGFQLWSYPLTQNERSHQTEMTSVNISPSRGVPAGTTVNVKPSSPSRPAGPSDHTVVFHPSAADHRHPFV